MAKFKKGQSGNPKGRPEGSKNRNAMRPVLWWNWFQDEVEALPPAQRVPMIKWAIEQMMPKVPVLPSTQAESAQNAAQMLELMNGLAPNNTPLESNPSAPQSNGNGDSQNGHG